MTKRRWSTLSTVLLALAPSCGGAAPISGKTPGSATVGGGASPRAAPAIALPFAEDVEDMIDDAPVVSVDGDRVLVDGSVAGDLSVVAKAGRIQRIDGLFEAMKARRDQWKAAHPGARFPGVDVLRIGGDVNAAVVKSVFQTAAFAGYPNASFAVQSIPSASGVSKTARVSADAQVPGPPKPGTFGEKEVPARVLHIELAKDKMVLIWRQGGVVTATVDVPRREVRTTIGAAEVFRLPDLASKIALEWKANGQHTNANDKAWDQAVVHVPDDTPHRVLIAMIDAAHAPKRSLMVGGRSENAPAFNVTFAMGPYSSGSSDSGSSASGSGGGRLAPETIQQVVRANFGKMRQCYENGLRRNPNLQGKIAARFTIETDGSVTHAEDVSEAGEAIPDPAVASCVVAVFAVLKFPKPEGGVVKVVYPIVFNPGE